jgi:putative ABC transport system permease protein
LSNGIEIVVRFYSNPPSMLTNFLTTAIRHLIKNRAYALLNIFGLSVGLGCFMLIGLWVKQELSYDRFHKNGDRIFRVSGIFTDESGVFNQAVTPIPLGPALASDLPEVEETVRIDLNSGVVRSGDLQFIEYNILGVDPSFFTVFDFRLLKGNPKTALDAPYNLVLSESIAKKYFGDEDPIGQTLRIFQYDPDGTGVDYKITGVVEDCPLNSHIQYSMLFSFSTIAVYDIDETQNWFNNGYYTYTLLKPSAEPAAVQSKFPSFIEKYMGKVSREYRMRYDYFLTPLKDIHLKSNLRYELSENSNMSYIIIFSAIGLMVLMLACINYINLSTAYSADRFKEVGIRKVMGAFRRQLVVQYLIESWMVAMCAMLLSIGWIEISRPFFEQLTGKQIVGVYSTASLLSLFLIASAAGILSGIYPSLILSGLRPVNILKGYLKKGTSGVWLRKGLVVLQYSVTVILISGILVVRTQLDYINERDLGFNEENLLVMGVNGSRDVMRGYEAFATELKSYPQFTSVARSNTSLGGGLGNSTAEAESADGKRINATMYRFRVDHEYIGTYQMKLVAGRNFIPGSSNDSTRAFIINETAARQFGYQDPGAAIGKYFSMSGMEGEVIGVVKDYHYNSLQHAIEPAAFTLLHGGFSRVSSRMVGNTKENVQKLTEIWKAHFPAAVIDFSLAEEGIGKRYVSEERFSSIFLVFSFISLTIACLGLFALVSYSIETRTKEIGIRKVLGATVVGIVNMLSREFLLLILISCVVAIPLAAYLMQQWLQNFAYRTGLQPGVFAVAGMITVVIAFCTIALKAIRSAMNNPVEALKNE